MKKCFIGFYDNLNLGDDLFVKNLCLRYPNTSFTICVNKSYKNIFTDIPNLKKKYYSSIFSKTSNFLKSKSSIDFKLIKNLKFIKKSDMYIKIGGSIFIENKNINYNNYKVEYLTNPNTYIISSNFGPYKTDEYLKFFKIIFSNVKDICFRDTYSKNLFKNSRYAADTIFSLKYPTKSGDKIVISVIDLESRKELSKYNDDYLTKMAQLVNNFTSQNKEVVLMSFCNNELDNKALDKIYTLSFNKDKVSKYFYKGDIDKALDIISSSSIVIGARFHANILGLLFNKVVVPVIYSEKTKNMLDDIGFTGSIIDIKNIKKLDISKLNFTYKKDISKNNSNLQFKELDKILR